MVHQGVIEGVVINDFNIIDKVKARFSLFIKKLRAFVKGFPWKPIVAACVSCATVFAVGLGMLMTGIPVINTIGAFLVLAVYFVVMYTLFMIAFVFGLYIVGQVYVLVMNLMK